MADYISREAAIKAAKCHYPKANEMIAGIILVPAADVVARDCYDRILAENDTMREMLARTGKKCGDSMDDVRPVVKASWKKDNSYAGPGLMNLRCSVCGEFGGTWRDCTLPSMLYKFCPNCGADMRPEKNDQRGEKQGRENRKTLR